MSCVTALAGHADKSRSRFLRNGRERPQRTFGRLKAEKVGSPPAQSGVFFCVTLLILVSFIPLFSRDLCTSQAEEDGEDEAEVRNFYLLHLLRQNPRLARAHRRKLLVGPERPTTHFGHRTACKSGVAPAQHGVLPAAKLIVAPCATACPLGSCSMAEVNARVTYRVICVFHAPVTFPRCEKRSTVVEIVESHTIKSPRKWKNSIKMFAPDPQETVLSIFMVVSHRVPSTY